MENLSKYLPLTYFLILGVGLVLIFRGRRRQAPDGATGPVGIRGWLVLPAISALLAPIAGIGYAALLLSDAGSTIFDDVRRLLLIDAVAQAAFGLFAIYAAWAFFRRKRRAPVLFVSTLVVGLATSFLDTALLSELGAASPFADDVATSYLVLDAILLVIWTAYMWRSVRVRNTFIEP